MKQRWAGIAGLCVAAALCILLTKSSAYEHASGRAPPSSSSKKKPVVRGVQYAAITGYDVSSAVVKEDNTRPYHLVEYIATPRFLQAVNVAAVHSKDAEKYLYHIIRITRSTSRTAAIFYVWDVCDNGDCSGCCDDNMNAAFANNAKYGDGFKVKRSQVVTLFDLDIQGAKRAFRIGNAASQTAGLEEVAQFEDLGTFDPREVAAKYGLRRS